MRNAVMIFALVLLSSRTSQVRAPQVLLAGRCHGPGDTKLIVRLRCADITGSLFCGVISSTLRGYPNTEMGYSDADSEVFLRVYKSGDAAGFYLGQPLIFPNGHSTGGTHYLKEGLWTYDTEDSTLNAKFVKDLIIPALENLRDAIEKSAQHKGPPICPQISDEKDWDQ
jgi:hypothetical protein